MNHVPQKHIHRIEPHGYERVRPLFAELSDINLHIEAVLDGTSPGRVYADGAAQPQAACITHGEVWYVGGNAGNHAFNTALAAMLPRDQYFVLFCDPNRWEKALEVILEGTYARRARRRYYVLRQLELSDWQASLPEGYAMYRVDAGLLNGDIDSSSIEEWILDEWASVDAFLAMGFGSCLVHGSDVVSWSLADYVQGDRCEIGIHARPDSRRQGFGTLTAAETASQAVTRGFKEIGWHCWDNNAGSIGVAENVGFAQAASYDVFINHWAAENITDMSQEEFRAFARDYEAEFKNRPPMGGYPHIVAATAWALGGDRAACFRHLNKTVDLGWLRDLDHLRELWPELFWNPNLDEMPEWRAFVRRLEAN
jgi:GNAT superfamily N-acetyltransferase